MPKEAKIVQTQWASGFKREMIKKSLKRLTQFLATVAWQLLPMLATVANIFAQDPRGKPKTVHRWEHPLISSTYGISQNQSEIGQ